MSRWWLKVALLTTSVFIGVCLDGKKVNENSAKLDDGAKNKVPAQELQENDVVKLKKLQERFFNVINNTTATHDVHSLKDLVSLLVTDAAGGELWRLLLEGAAIGMGQKDSPAILMGFWSEAQERLNPEIIRSIKSYMDLGSMLDVRTLSLLLEQIPRKDELLDKLQASLDRYGIDIKDVVDSVLGKGDVPMKDFLVKGMGGIAGLARNVIQSSENRKPVPLTEERTPTKTTGPSGTLMAKKGNLALLTPLVAKLLKDKTIDLEAEAVVELLEYFTGGGGDLMKYAAPLMALAEGRSGGLAGLAQMAPMLMNLMGQGQRAKDGGKTKKKKEPGMKAKEPDMMGVVGSLLGGLNGGGGADEEVNIASMLSLAANFMGNSEQKKKAKREKEAAKGGMDLGLLMKAASQMAKANNIDLGDMTDLAGHILRKPTPAKNKQGESKTRDDVRGQNFEKAEKTTTRSSAPVRDADVSSEDTTTSSQTKRGKSAKASKNLFDVIGPIVLSMKTGKQCSIMIEQALTFGRNLLAKKKGSLHELKDTLPGLLHSYMDSKTLKNLTSKLNIPIIIDMISKSDWKQFVDILQNDVFRQNIIRTITPHVTDFVQLLAMDKAQKNIDEMVQNLLASYGFSGVTLDNFPERLGPMIGFLSNGLNLPFKPQDHLPSIRDYLKSTKTWVVTGLREMSELQKEELNQRVYNALEDDLAGGVLLVARLAKNDKISGSPTTPPCRQQLLCRVNAKAGQEHPDSLRTTVVRTASMAFALAPSLDSTDSESLHEILKSIYQSDTEDMCMEKYPGDCYAVNGQALEDMKNGHRSHHISHEDL